MAPPVEVHDSNLVSTFHLLFLFSLSLFLLLLKKSLGPSGGEIQTLDLLSLYSTSTKPTTTNPTSRSLWEEEPN